MHIRKYIVALLLCISVPAAADFVVVSKAYEVSLADLRLPGNTNGTITFKECETCDYLTVRVTAATRYEANDHTFTLEGFRKEVEQVKDPRDVTATVLHHLESDTIEAVRVWF